MIYNLDQMLLDMLTINKLYESWYKEFDTALKRVKELEGWAAGAKAQCSYCGDFLFTEDGAHWETCKKHPAKERIEKLKEENDLLVEMLNATGCRELCCATCRYYFYTEWISGNSTWWCHKGIVQKDQENIDPKMFSCSEWESKENNSE